MYDDSTFDDDELIFDEDDEYNESEDDYTQDALIEEYDLPDDEFEGEDEFKKNLKKKGLIMENVQLGYDAQIADCDNKIQELQKEIERLKNEKTKAQMQLESINKEIEKNKEAFRKDFPDLDIEEVFEKENEL